MASSEATPHPREPGDAAGHPRRHRGPGRGGRLWLLRHAQVHADWQGKAYGNLDVPLSPEGLARTAELAEAFARVRPCLILSSPLERARQLGEALAERSGGPLELRAELAEIDRGAWQGSTVSELKERRAEEVREFYADPWSWRGHGGESDEQLLARVLPALDQGLERAAGGTLAVTTHYNVIRVVAAAALGVPPVRSFALRVDPGRALLLVDTPEGWHLHHSNVHGPPAEEERA
jgi:broad specificity phosphatase PhoE